MANERKIRRPANSPAGRACRRLLAPAALAGILAAPLAAAAATVNGVDLDRFDASKQVVALPDGISLAYLEMGNPSGRPVVLIHGYTDNARDWVPMIPFMSSRDRLIVVDIRGHGASSKPECCYTRVDFAYDVKLLLDRLGVARADIVGHSLGSLIAQAFAESWPERTRKVVLVSSTGGPRPGAPAPKLDFAAEIRKLHEPIDPDSAFMLAWWSSPTPVDEEFMRRQRRDSARIPLPVWLAVLDQGLDLAGLQAALARLQAPCLLLWGEDDPIFGADARATLRGALPSARVMVFPHLGHNPFWEDPRAVAAAIDGFLDAPGP
jgi:pimeloyl-ACP methyl ester carboxylesterase